MSPNSYEPLVAGERIAKLSVVTLLVVGVGEILVGRVSLSLGLTADGVTSLLNSVDLVDCMVRTSFFEKAA